MKVTTADAWFSTSGVGTVFVYKSNPFFYEVPNTALFSSKRSSLPRTNNRFNDVEHLRYNGELELGPELQATLAVNVGEDFFTTSLVRSSTTFEEYSDFVTLSYGSPLSAFLAPWWFYATVHYTRSRKSSSDEWSDWNAFFVGVPSSLSYRIGFDDDHGRGSFTLTRRIWEPRDSFKPAPKYSLQGLSPGDGIAALIIYISACSSQIGEMQYASSYWRSVPVLFSLKQRGSSVEPGKEIQRIYQQYISPAIVKPYDPSVWGKLAAEAYGTNEFWDGNGIQSLSELRSMRSAAQSTADALKGLGAKKLSRRIKAASSLYLGFHYGWKLTVAGAYDLSKAFADFDAKVTKRVQSDMVVEVSEKLSVQYRYQVFYKEYEKLTDDIRRLEECFDLIPDLSNTWDSIPYSFVVDWFTNVGDVLQSIDAYLDFQQKHRVLAVGKSVKACYHLTDSCDITYYHRWYSPDLQMPDYTISSSIDARLVHLVEAGALVTQRI